MIVGLPLILCLVKLGFMLLPKNISADIKNRYLTFAILNIPNSKSAYSSLKLPKI
jgi:hypothetical protein